MQNVDAITFTRIALNGSKRYKLSKFTGLCLKILFLKINASKATTTHTIIILLKIILKPAMIIALNLETFFSFLLTTTSEIRTAKQTTHFHNQQPCILKFFIGEKKENRYAINKGTCDAIFIIIGKR